MLGGGHAQRGLLRIAPHHQVGGEDPVHEKAAQQSAKEKLAARGRARSRTLRRQFVLVPWAGVLFNGSSERGDVDNGRFHPRRRSTLLLEELRQTGDLRESRTLALGEDGINEDELRADRLGQQTNDSNLAGSQDARGGPLASAPVNCYNAPSPSVGSPVVRPAAYLPRHRDAASRISPYRKRGRQG